MLTIKVKTYKDLGKDELYNILQLRSEVFVVEQDCVYQDIDGKDQKALHVIGRKNNKIIAYTHLFKQGDYFIFTVVKISGLAEATFHKELRPYR